MRKRKLMALTLTAALCGSTVNTSMLTTVRAEEYQQVEKPTEETGKPTAMAEGAPDTGKTASERRAEDKQGNEKQETAAEEDSEVRSESKTKTETETGTEAEAEAESEAGAESKNETEAEIGTEAETEIETETEAEIPTEAETETEAEVESETAETESESASEAEQAEQRETAQTKPEEEHPSSASNQPPSKLATASVPTETLEAAPSSLLLAAEADGFEVEDGKLTAYSGEAEEIVIPDNVSIIGEAAFKGNDIIVSVTIPASVEQIETGAFQNCENLKTVFFEEGSALTEIPEDCFSGNDALEEVSLPEGITKIGAGAFASLGRSFESITLPASVEMLGETGSDVFSHSKALSRIEIAEGGVGFYSYDGVVYKTEGNQLYFAAPARTGAVEVQDGTESIAPKAFYNAEVTYISLPDSLVEIGEQAFCGSELMGVVIPGSVETIGDMAFYNSKLVSVVLEDGVKKIGGMAFETCYSLIGLRLPASVETAGDGLSDDNGSLFQMLRVDGSDTKLGLALVDYYMPIKVVGETDSAVQAFYDKLAAEKGDKNKLVFIPASDYVETEDIETSVSQKGLEIAETFELTAKALPEDATAPAVGFYSTNTEVAAVSYDKKTGIATVKGQTEGEADIVAVTADGIRKSVHVTVGWGEDQTEVQIDENGLVTGYLGSSDVLEVPEEINGTAVTGIAEEAFADSELTEVTLPDSLKNIGPRAFAGSEHLRTINLPVGLEEIGAEAFADTALQTLVVPETVSSIGKGAFQGMMKLVHAEIKAPLKELSDGLFKGDNALEKVLLPDSLELIGSEAFSGCSVLQDFALPASLKEVGEKAFASCTALNKISLPEGVTDVRRKAFFNCTGLTELNIPAATTNLGDGLIRDLFEDKETDPGAKKLLNLNIAEGNPVYQSEDGLVYDKEGTTFLFCPRGRTELGVREGTVKIGDYAAFICFELKKIELPSTLKEVGEDAFHYCENVTELTLPEGLETVRHSGFFGLENWKEVVIPSTVKTIEAYGFAECGASVLEIPAGIERIENYAFWGYEGTLEQLILPDSVNYIGEDAFSWGKKVQHVYVPQAVTYIGAEAFGRFDSLSYFTAPASIQEIGERAFVGNQSMQGLFIPSGIQTIAADSLKNVPDSLIVFSDAAGGTAERFAEASGHRFVVLNTERGVDADILVEDVQNLVSDKPEVREISLRIADESGTAETKDARVAAVKAGHSGSESGLVFQLTAESGAGEEAETLSGQITLSIRIPEALLASEQPVQLYQLKDGTSSLLPSTIIGNRLFAAADANGVYALAAGTGEEQPEQPEQPEEPEVQERPTNPETPEQESENSSRGAASGSSGGSGLAGRGYVASLTENGWTQTAEGWRYESTAGQEQTGWRLLPWEGKEQWFYFDAAGYLRGGWVTAGDGQRFYLHNVHDGKFGVMYTGWHKIDGSWMYFNQEGDDGVLGALNVEKAVPKALSET